MDSEPKENSELLNKVQDVELLNSDLPKPESNGVLRSSEARSPPDGGVRAYLVLVGSFLTNGLLFGVINSCGVMYGVLERQTGEQGIDDPKGKAALVGSLAMGITFLLSPLSGVLTALLGLRLTAVLGGAIATAGLLLSSFVTQHVYALYFTYGVVYGAGASLAYTPSLAILSHYFKKYLGLVNGIVTIGSSVFTVIMTSLMDHLIKNHGLDWMFRVLALFTLGIALCGLLFKPIPLMVLEKPLRTDNSFKSLIKTIVNVQIWKNTKYRFWALSMPVALFGYFVPYVHIKEFVMQNFDGLDETRVNLPLQTIALTSGIGRLTFGYLADKPGVDRILMQQISFYIIGTLTMILPAVNTYWLAIVISAGMGICDGAFISLIGPIAVDLCGGAHAAHAIGCMLGLAALPLSIGPPIAGTLRGHSGSYTLPFVLAGISPLIGATLMFAIRLHNRGRKTEQDSNTNGRISPLPNENEKQPALSPTMNKNGELTSL